MARWTAPAAGIYSISVAIGGTKAYENGGTGNFDASLAGLKINGTAQSGSYNATTNVYSWQITNVNLNLGGTIDAYINQRDGGGNTQTIFTVQLVNNMATVNGQIALDGVVNQNKIVYPVGNITFEFRTPGTSPYDPVNPVPVLFTKTGMLTTDGTNPGFGDYTLTGVTFGTYDVTIKSRNSLRKVLSNVNILGNTQTISSVLLLGGDANGDNVVNTADFNMLIGAFGGIVSIPGSGYDQTVDFNFDGSVNTLDFNLLIGEFDNQGDL